MPALQTTFNDFPPVGLAGMVANGETSNRISRTNEGATAIPFGRPVYRGAGDHGCVLTPAAGGLLGISMLDRTNASANGGGVDSYPQYATVGIMTQGVIWVVAGEAVTDGAQAYSPAAGGNPVDTAAGNVILPGWFFDGTAANGELVRLAKR